MIWEQLNVDLMMTQAVVGDQIDLLIEMGDRFVAGGYCKPMFTEAVIHRERLYPTGIQLERIGVAIPHADSEFVIKEAVGFAILEEPVCFQQMGGTPDEEPLAVSMVIMLASMGRDHIDLLQCIVSLLQDNVVLDRLLKATEENEMIQIIKKWEEHQ